MLSAQCSIPSFICGSVYLQNLMQRGLIQLSLIWPVMFVLYFRYKAQQPNDAAGYEMRVKQCRTSMFFACLKDEEEDTVSDLAISAAAASL